MAIEYPHGITVTPIMESDGSAFGAEVAGVDFTHSPLPDAVIATVSDEAQRSGS
jgi:hypothetical protein